MTDNEFFKKLGQIHRMYDAMRKRAGQASGDDFLRIKREENRMIAELVTQREQSA